MSLQKGSRTLLGLIVFIICFVLFCFVVIDVTCAPEARTEVQLSFLLIGIN